MASSKRDTYAFIGEKVWKDYPHIAVAIVEKPTKALHPIQLVQDYREKLPNISRRHFVGVIMKIYNPGYIEYCKPPQGLVSILSFVLGMHKQHVSSMYQQVRVHMIAYDDFNNEVENYKREVMNGCA